MSMLLRRYYGELIKENEEQPKPTKKEKKPKNKAGDK